MKGSCQVIPRAGGFESMEIFELIKAWPNLSFFAAPTMVKRLLMSPIDSDTSNLKTVIYGGGPMYVEDILQAMDRFGNKFTQLYGQGESPMTITSLNQDFHAMKGSSAVSRTAWLGRTFDERPSGSHCRRG